MKIEWLDDGMTRARVTVEAASSRWWRRRYLVAEVERREDRTLSEFRWWHFVIGGDRVVDHDARLASGIEEKRWDELARRAELAERAKLKNPWTAVAPLPPARTVKR